MGQIIFVVARESIEALLIIGILFAWMSSREGAEKGKHWIYAGVLAGLGLATLLALTLVGVTHFLGGEARSWFEIGMLTLASTLIVQMVMWMRSHGRTLKKEMENRLDRDLSAANWWGVFFLVTIAVGREGSETAMFLYGSFLQLATWASYASFFGAVAIGLAIAMVLFYLLQLGNRFISWKWFFRITEIMLLFLGASLFLTASEKLLNGYLSNVDLPAWFYSSVWNTSHILSESSLIGDLLASLFAYRSRPIGWDLVTVAVFALVVWRLLAWQSTRQAQQTRPQTQAAANPGG
ncbi:MAG: FTR1 family protein [Gammaproteobacteria bacterium]|nr:FTR1 family protein [Gammaproteobacteria bacterium]